MSLPIDNQSACQLRVKPGNVPIEHMFSAFTGSRHADRRTCGVEIGRRDVIQASKAGGRDPALGTVRHVHRARAPTRACVSRNKRQSMAAR